MNEENAMFCFIILQNMRPVKPPTGAGPARAVLPLSSAMGLASLGSMWDRRRAGYEVRTAEANDPPPPSPVSQGFLPLARGFLHSPTT